MNLCRQYISQVRCAFPVLGKRERTYIHELKKDVNYFCEKNQPSSLTDFYEAIGSPTEIVQNYYLVFDTDYVITRLNISSFIKKTMVVATLLIALCISTYIVTSYLIEQSLVRQAQVIQSDNTTYPINNNP